MRVIAELLVCCCIYSRLRAIRTLACYVQIFRSYYLGGLYVQSISRLGIVKLGFRTLRARQVNSGPHLQPRPLLPPPPRFLRNHLRRSLPDGQNSQHRIRSGHLRKTSSIGDPHPLQTSQPQLRIHHGHVIFFKVAHLRGAGGMVDGMRHLPAVG